MPCRCIAPPQQESGEKCGLAPAKLTRPVRHNLSDRVEVPRLWMAWHSPAVFTPGDAEMDLVANVLSAGKVSRLHRALVYEQRLALQVSAYQSSRRQGSLFVVEVTAAPGTRPAQLERATDRVLHDIRQRPITARELKRARARLQTDTVTDLQKLRSRADRINRYLALVGQPDYLARDLARYERATVQSVNQAARQVIDPHHQVVLWVVPSERKP